ncbi:uncharacterized protein EV420DRAFT_1646353 [Desarmillaria tabescens]|uniref:Uncharacterized protein n=1 Tax=Armillaria tabescens TaxID=1929756 RepID=A0AA39MYE0_ARMTA|nr:uncharacterized protein EV420DRAFT_1646353 [Desarmillaria tabescens]KAK0451262.1 hypothetical protein EV420DRAFT_1646353 [Desarmillaria tabescens]
MLVMITLALYKGYNALYTPLPSPRSSAMKVVDGELVLRLRCVVTFASSAQKLHRHRQCSVLPQNQHVEKDRKLVLNDFIIINLENKGSGSAFVTPWIVPVVSGAFPKGISIALALNSMLRFVLQGYLSSPSFGFLSFLAFVSLLSAQHLSLHSFAEKQP